MFRIYLAILYLAAVSAFAQPADTAARLRQLFSNPPSSYRPMPLYVWNGEMTEAGIDRSLAEFKAQGFGGVFIHPRPGLITEYLSDRWFALCRYTLDRGKNMGLEVWLYDENSYPSGFAGGHVPAEMPESYEHGQGLRLTKAPTSPGGCKVEVGGYCFELAYYPKTSWHAGYSYVDLLKPGVTQKFIDVTMKGYERAYGKELGTSVPGIFTDEPEISAPGRNTMRWTPDLFEQFRKRWGYDLHPLLPALFEETGDWRKVRHDYYALLLDLFIERWSKPWHEYTTAKGLKWTGHYWDHGWPNPDYGPDNMAMYAWHQMPGIDLLFNQFDEEKGDQFGDVRIPRELASVANQLGLRRTLSETYGGGGHELRFEDMKRLGDWQYALGVNFTNPHLSFQTMMGARKYDYPQTFSYHSPWWPHFRAVSDYFSRLSVALSAGEQRNRVLVIEPTTTGWMYASRGAADPRLRAIESAFRPFLNRLEARQVEYDLASERILRDHANADGSRFVVGKRDYDLVILPPGMENLEQHTFQLLRDYLGGGGKLISFVDPPARLDGALSDEPRTLATQRGWARVETTDAIPAPEGFESIQGKLLHQRRVLKDGELLFFVNYSLEARASATATAPRAQLIQLDPNNGRAPLYPGRTQRGRMSFSVDLPPGGSLLLLSTDGAVTGSQPEAAARHTAGVPVTPQTPLTARRIEPNVLRIDYCDVDLGGRKLKDQYFYTAQETVFKHFGVGTNPWNSAVQYKTAIVDKYKFAPDSGFEAAFRFQVASGVERTGMAAIVERPELWSVAINGKPVQQREGAWYVDTAFGVYDIGAYVVDGGNTVTLTAKPMTIHTELEPVHIVGRFSVTPQSVGFRIEPEIPLSFGSWKTQGLPFYWQTAGYRASWKLRRDKPAAVRLGKWFGSVAEVRVNGKHAGVIGWQPYELDISPLVRDGDNEVEVVVYGSMQPLFGPHHGKIQPGLVSPGSFRHGPPSPPAGHDYRQLDYGLFESFTVLQ